MPHRHHARLAALVLCAALLPAAAHATLGERVESIEADRARLSARAAAPLDLGRYRVHTLTSPTSTVRQFGGPDGVIFAVAWDGVAVPDLPSLLGAHHEDYLAARTLQRPRRGARSARVTGRQVVVETWGRMRDLHGLAYLPALLPAGVGPDGLR
jgi:hypothetical protein